MIAMSVTTNAGTIAVKYSEASKVYAKNLTGVMRQVERETVRNLKGFLGAVMNRFSGRSIKWTYGKYDRNSKRQLVDDGDLTLRVRSHTYYARGHEIGAVRSPKRSAHLTVPLSGAANTTRGAIAWWGDRTKKTAAFTARQVIASPGTYGFTGTFARNGIIFGRLLEHDIVPLFALKNTITLRARYPHEFSRRVMAPRVRELLGASTDNSTRDVVKGVGV